MLTFPPVEVQAGSYPQSFIQRFLFTWTQFLILFLSDIQRVSVAFIPRRFDSFGDQQKMEFRRNGKKENSARTKRLVGLKLLQQQQQQPQQQKLIFRLQLIFFPPNLFLILFWSLLLFFFSVVFLISEMAANNVATIILIAIFVVIICLFSHYQIPTLSHTNNLLLHLFSYFLSSALPTLSNYVSLT